MFSSEHAGPVRDACNTVRAVRHVVAAVATREFETGIQFQASGSVFFLRQRVPEPRIELAEIKAVDDAVAVEVEVAQVIRIAVLGAERIPEDSEIETVDGLVAVHVAIVTEETLRVTKYEVAAGDSVGIAIQGLSAGADLRSECRERVSAVAQGTELGFWPGEIAEHHNRAAVLNADGGRETHRAAAVARQRECLIGRAAEGDLSAEADRQRCDARSLAVPSLT